MSRFNILHSPKNYLEAPKSCVKAASYEDVNIKCTEDKKISLGNVKSNGEKMCF